ncbi:MAG: gamma-glutamyltransferase family protein [Pseudomonadota bacterium]|nr:gamma-glutamyltransferase family protein [Pseudomonadota bacterium]
MPQFTTRPEILGTFGVVASTHWLATSAGMRILEIGGNAFDAAVAVGFTLQVVEPHLNGPGGEVPIIISSGQSNQVQVICGQGIAPQAATIPYFKDLGLTLVPGTGLLPAVVPGAFDAWMILLRDHGTLDLETVLEPALGYAESGYPLVPAISSVIEQMSDLFTADWPSSAEIYLANGIPAPGSLFRNRELAATYRRLVSDSKNAGGSREHQIEAARESWYRGFIAEAIDLFCTETAVLDTSGRRHTGLLRGDDLATWHATVEDPVTYDYHNHTLCKTGPWGQGPVALQHLALLNQFDLSEYHPEDPDFIHLLVETAKLAFADREAFYGDPDFVAVPLDHLLSPEYNAGRAQLVNSEASLSLRPGNVPGYSGAIAELPVGPDESASPGEGEPTVASAVDALTRGERHGDTCHLDVIDRWGNMVSATPSGGWLSSSPVIPGLGFPLTTRGQMFWLDENTAASLAPGKRPRTTLTPSLALRDGEPYLAFGTPGGDQQDQWSLHVFLKHLHYGMNLQEAIDSPDFHSTHFRSSFYPRVSNPGQVIVEGRLDPQTVEALRQRGHQIEVEADWSLGRCSAAARDGRLLRAAANPRQMQGYAVGR